MGHSESDDPIQGIYFPAALPDLFFVEGIKCDDAADRLEPSTAFLCFTVLFYIKSIHRHRWFLFYSINFAARLKKFLLYLRSTGGCNP